MNPGSVGLGFIAGLLSTLSPCVLPLLPLILGAAVAEHRFGMLALTSGMTLSFVGVGLFVATIGFAIGLDAELFRFVSGVLLLGFGAMLLSSGLRARFAVATGGWSNAGNALLARITPAGWQGQLLIGLVLGVVWTPCVGPTLGAASVLASRGQDLFAVALVMLAFGLGAAVPLILVGSLSRGALARWRGRMLGTGERGKAVLGLGLVAVGLLILTGADHRLEAELVAVSPAWLGELTTRF